MSACSIFRRSIVTFIRRIWMLPNDENASGIVVRVLNHTYYMETWTLKFKDPFMEVEYDLTMRRKRMCKLRSISLVLVVSSAVLYTYSSLDSYWDMAHMSQIFSGSLFVVSLGLLIMVRIFPYSFEWTQLGTFVFSIWFIWVGVYKYQHGSSDSEFMINMTNATHMYHFTDHPDTTNLLCHIPTPVYILTCTTILLLLSLCLRFYQLCLVCVIIETVMVHVVHFLEDTNDALIVMNLFRSILTNVDGNNQNVKFALEEVRMLMDYHNEKWAYVIYWTFFSIFLIFVKRSDELILRENFLMKRVRSNKDPKKLDNGGVYVSENDLRVIDCNLTEWKYVTPPRDTSVEKIREFPGSVLEVNRNPECHESDDVLLEIGKAVTNSDSDNYDSDEHASVDTPVVAEQARLFVTTHHLERKVGTSIVSSDTPEHNPDKPKHNAALNMLVV